MSNLHSRFSSFFGFSIRESWKFFCPFVMIKSLVFFGVERFVHFNYSATFVVFFFLVVRFGKEESC